MIILLFLLTPVGGTMIFGQTPPQLPDEIPPLKLKFYEGRKKIIDEFGDEIWMYYFKPFTKYPDLRFRNQQEAENYGQLVAHVRATLPLAKTAFNALQETYEYIQTIPDSKLREKHLKTLEKDVVARYKPTILKMSKTRGKVLLKLVHRETEQSGYNIVKAFLGSFRATFWQTFGSFFGMNMKAGFHPESNREDALIDRIATELEQGTLW